MDMLADESQRDEISEGKKILWLTPGWILYRNHVFQDWDKGKANENFPQYSGGAVLLDGIGFWERYSEEHPVKILEFSDWMGIEIRPHKVTLDRLKNLLAGCVVSDLQKEVAELRSRLPAHSAKPAMIQQKEEIEEKLIIDFILKNGQIKRSQVMEILKCGETKAKRILKEMTKEHLEKITKGKYTYYILKNTK